MSEQQVVELTKERLLAEFDELDSAIENAAINPTWRLADWLAEHVPNNGRGNAPVGALTLDELAERSSRGRQWLNAARQAAEAFPASIRIAGVSVKVHITALRDAKGDVNAALEAMADKPKLRDWTPNQDIEAAKRVVQNPKTRKELIERLDSKDRLAIEDSIDEVRVKKIEENKRRVEIKTNTDTTAKKIDEMGGSIEVDALASELHLALGNMRKAIRLFLGGLTEQLPRAGRPGGLQVLVPDTLTRSFDLLDQLENELPNAREGLERIKQWYETGETDIDAFTRSVLREER